MFHDNIVKRLFHDHTPFIAKLAIIQFYILIEIMGKKGFIDNF